MHRRKFIEKTMLASSFMLAGFSLSQKTTDVKLLTGIGTPDLCGEGYLLLREVYDAYYEMSLEAEKDGIRLWCTSGYRSFEYQRGIWNNKFKVLKKSFPANSDSEIINSIMEYSSFPGTSRHHWGTDLDIVDAFGHDNGNPLYHENFEIGGNYQYLGHWLDQNASRFGFFQVYTKDEARKGFEYEPWHFSYASMSKTFYREMLQVSFEKVEEIKDCKGFEYFKGKFLKEYFEKYVSGINPILK